MARGYELVRRLRITIKILFVVDVTPANAFSAVFSRVSSFVVISPRRLTDVPSDISTMLMHVLLTRERRAQVGY
ncbi:MAG TPA: hypothetical protein VKM94_15580, partial [Blastocatellia bacterium]|nr:hypothetical protein [Blastocatellia bacterium]